MAWTNPKTWLAAVLSVADMNTEVRDNLNFLKENIALGAAVELTIATGAITKTKTYHTITVQGGAGAGSDQLDSCAGGSEGDILILKPTTTGGSDTVTIADGTGAGTFILEAGAAFAMDHVDDRWIGIHNGTEWVEISRSTNS